MRGDDNKAIGVIPGCCCPDMLRVGLNDGGEDGGKGVVEIHNDKNSPFVYYSPIVCCCCHGDYKKE